MANPTVFTPIANDPIYLGTATGTSAGTIYTSGAGGAILDYITVVCTNGTADQVTVYYEQGGGTAAGSNTLANAVTIPGDGYGVNLLSWAGGRPFHMEASSKIRGYAETGTAFVCHVGGVDYA